MMGAHWDKLNRCLDESYAHQITCRILPSIEIRQLQDEARSQARKRIVGIN